MSRSQYRRRAILTRIHDALDAFYLLQRIDWEYDFRATLERILGLALDEIELEGEKVIERALVIVQEPDGEHLEVHAGWKTEQDDLSFSRTIVQQTIERAEPVLCENAKSDPRFMEAESLRQLTMLSLSCVPLLMDGRAIGAFYVESASAGSIFDQEDLAFFAEFAACIAPYVKTGLTHRSHVREIRKLRDEISERYAVGNMVGRSAAIRSVFELVAIAADLDRTVLITGESGSGKELVARAIHHGGHRRMRRFVVVDCSSLSENLLESELFGHAAGSFTGAVHEKTGAFEEASGGTLFLDEINDASRSLQQKLRRVLQEGEIRRVGETQVRKVDVRVICATNRDLPSLVSSGEFIHDLYHRIHRFPIHLPPLRERREDVPLLAQHFLELQDQREGHARARRITPDAMAALVARDWRANNIRELRNTVELAADLAPSEVLDRRVFEKVFRLQGGGPAVVSAAERSDVSNHGRGRIAGVDPEQIAHLLNEAQLAAERGEDIAREATPFYRAQVEFEALAIIEGLRFARWKVSPAASRLGISRTKLRESLKRYLAAELERHEGDLEKLALALDIPPEILSKKADDFGLAGVSQRPPSASS